MQPAHTKPRRFGGRFETEYEVGHGGMGAVYRARDLQTGQPAAVKVLFEREGPNAERFVQEAVMLAELSHPAIVRYLGHGVAPSGEHYLAMEWLEGRTLEDYLTGGAVPVLQAVQLTARVVDALAVAHRRGVVHRDIKPANLLLPESRISHAKLLDFGIARRLFDTRRITRTGATLGTPMYMSPEQARGLTDVDARSDVFSMGCVLFECLAGQPPFTGETPLAVLAKICLEVAPDVRRFRPEVSPALAALVRGMLEKDPEKRPGDTAELARMLAVMADELRTGVPANDGHAADYKPLPIVTPGEQRLFSVVLVQLPRKGPKQSPASRSSSSLLVATTNITGVVNPPTPVSLKAIRGLWRKGVNTPLPPTPGAATPGDMPAVESEQLPPDLYDDQVMARVRKSALPFGVQVDRFYNGSLALTNANGGSSAEQTFEMARCALEMRRLLPMAAFAVATGRADGDAPMPVGKVLERAGRLLAGAPPSVIRLDDLSHELLASRFETSAVPGADQAARLLFEKGLREPPRTLFGKPTPCIGRDRELSSLQSLFAEVLDDSVARAVIVTAPAGGGKSRVRHELMERLYSRGTNFSLLAGRGESMRAGSAWSLLGGALRAAADVSGYETLDVQRLRFGAYFGRRFTKPEDRQRVVSFLGEIANIRFPDDDFPMLRSTRQDPRAMADQTRAAWLDWVEAELDHAPVVLVFEDLHWGDAATFGLVDAALRLYAEKRLLVMGFARPTLDEKYPGLWNGRNVERLGLPPLSAKNARRLVQAALPTASDEQADALCARADGNPFFLEELLRASVERGNDVAQASPASILSIIQGRFDSLGDGVKRVLRAASVFGMSFRRSGVGTLIGESNLKDVEEYLDVLVAREIVYRRASGSGREYMFRHALVREAAYDTLTDRDRKVGHLLAGEFLERLGAENPGELAEHFECAEEMKRAGHWHYVAGQRALASVELENAIKHCERAVKCGVEGEELGLVKLLEARVQIWRANYEDARLAGVEATKVLDGVANMEAWGEVVVALGHLRWDMFQNENEEAYLEALQRLQQHVSKDLGWAIWARSVLRACSFWAAAQQASDALNSSGLLAEALASAEPAVSASASCFQYYVMCRLRRWEEAEHHCHRAVACFEAAGNFQEAASNQLNLVSYLADLARYDKALLCAEECLRKVRKNGIPFHESLALANLADIYWELGRVDDSARAALEACDLAQRHGILRVAVFGWVAAARALSEQGRHDEARCLLLKAKDGSNGSPELHAFLSAVQGMEYLAQSQLLLAVACAHDAAVALCADSVQQLFVRVAIATIQKTCGSPAAFESAVAEAQNFQSLLSPPNDDTCRCESFKRLRRLL
ncbi:MAG: protein kinase [Deltaproteobacteria bacterium]|nr:protein kinase [Deltaproteobacteria bacterium]